jgi:RNA recognition motif-containing protein
VRGTGEAVQGNYKPKFQDKIVFVGQLPYNATLTHIEHFFARKGLSNFKVRMLNDKSPERKFRGIAFVEFSKPADASKALKFDRHFFGDRRIRVERTATGGGNNPKRRGRLQRSKEQQEQDKRQQIEGILDRIFARRDAKALASAPDASTPPAAQDDPSIHPSRRQAEVEGGKNKQARDVSLLMTRQDCDDQLVAYLCSLPDKIAAQAARACSRLEVLLKPQAPNPKPYTLNPQPQAPSPKP